MIDSIEMERGARSGKPRLGGLAHRVAAALEGPPKVAIKSTAAALYRPEEFLDRSKAMSASVPRLRKRDLSKSEAGLINELTSFHMLDRDQLKRRWRKLYGMEPPPMVSRTLLKYAIAYAMQVEFWGDVKPAVLKMIEGCLQSNPAQTNVAPVGTKLFRQWKGKIHEVEILDEGVSYQGARYKSLSKVAKLISGIHRSGPHFFGLRAKLPSKMATVSKLGKQQHDAVTPPIEAPQI